jgi:hypothetical protein
MTTRDYAKVFTGFEVPDAYADSLDDPESCEAVWVNFGALDVPPEDGLRLAKTWLAGLEGKEGTISWLSVNLSIWVAKWDVALWLNGMLLAADDFLFFVENAPGWSICTWMDPQ